MASMRKAIPLLLVVVLGAACSKTSQSSGFPSCTPHGFTSPGESLPDCTFEGFPGQPALRLVGLRGKPVVMNFWGSWCIACVRELPAMQRVSQALAGRVTFVGIDPTGVQGETEGAGENFARRAAITYRLAFDPNGMLLGHFVATVLRPTMPVTVFVNARGVVVERHFGGPLSERELRGFISLYLGVR
jgi:cytochrome c biogenesis protein CcmG, thiol:disulfide interchange protein DsbE